MRAIDLKERIDAICSADPNVNVVMKIEHLDGSYNVCDTETVNTAIFNGLFLIQPEVHEVANCAIIVGSEIPSDELIVDGTADDIIMNKAALEQAYLDGALDANQFITALSSYGYLNLP